MSLVNIPPLTDIDHEQFAQLIGRESVTWDGQVLLMSMIPDMIRTRIVKERAVFREHLHTSLHRSQGIEDQVKNHLSDISVQDVNLQNGQIQWVIGRGDHARGKKSKHSLNVFVPSHIDTVIAQDKKFYSLQSDPRHPKRRKGRGVYDMKQGVLNSIALASQVNVPPGMNVFFGFSYDEERGSAGAKAFIDNWEWWEDIDIVLGSEIGHVDVQNPATDMPYLIGRRGRLKYHAKLNVAESSQGHFAENHVRSAGHALGEAIENMIHRFNGKQSVAGKPLKRRHPHFIEEKLEIGSSCTERADIAPLISQLKAILGEADANTLRSRINEVLYEQNRAENLREQQSSPATFAEFYYNIICVPGRGTADSLAEQRAVFDEIAQKCSWAKHGINWTITHNERETSYEAFEMPQEHPLAELVKKKLGQIVPNAYPDYGQSVADENLYAASLMARFGQKLPPYKGVISIPPIGGGAHGPDEWVDMESVAAVRHAHRMLIEHPDGLLTLQKIKAQKVSDKKPIPHK